MITATNLPMRNTPPLNFTLAKGQTHGLVGANGIGKTTLLRMMAGQFPSSGLNVFGQDPFDLPYVMDRTILMGIDNPLPAGWNVSKLFALGRARWQTWNEQRAQELIGRFELPMKNYSGLSRGQKSAAGIIMAIASGCELVLLDEPYLGLDMAKRQEFFRVLREEQGKRTIVISTHHLREVADYLDTVTVLSAAPFHSSMEEIVDAVVEISGAAEAAEECVVGLPVLAREHGPLGAKILADARGHDLDILFAQATGHGLRARTADVETALRLLSTAPGPQGVANEGGSDA